MARINPNSDKTELENTVSTNEITSEFSDDISSDTSNVLIDIDGKNYFVSSKDSKQIDDIIATFNADNVNNLLPEDINSKPDLKTKVFLLNDDLEWYAERSKMNDKILSLQELEYLYLLVPDNVNEENPYYRYNKLREEFLLGIIRNESFLERFRIIHNPSKTRFVHFSDKIHINIELINDSFSSSLANGIRTTNSLLSGILLGALLTSLGAISTAVYALRIAQAAEKELLLAEQQLTVSITPDGRLAVIGRWKGFGLFEKFFKDANEKRLNEITRDSFRRGSREIWSLFSNSKGKVNVDKPYGD